MKCRVLFSVKNKKKYLFERLSAFIDSQRFKVYFFNFVTYLILLCKIRLRPSPFSMGGLNREISQIIPEVLNTAI